jgi:hypothetical protein
MGVPTQSSALLEEMHLVLAVEQPGSGETRDSTSDDGDSLPHDSTPSPAIWKIMGWDREFVKKKLEKT